MVGKQKSLSFVLDFFELFVGGMECSDDCSEQNHPIDLLEL